MQIGQSLAIVKPNSQQDTVALYNPSIVPTILYAYMMIMFFSPCLFQMHFHNVYCAQYDSKPPILSNIQQITDIL